MSRSLCLDSLSDNELLERLSTLIDRQRRVQSDVVAHIAEADARKLYLDRACSSMHAYCCEVLHLSEAEAYLRITCARLSRRFPLVLDMLGDGRLHLSAIAKLAPHLTEDNVESLLGRAAHKSKRKVEELVAEVAPRPDVPARMRKLPRAQPGRSCRGGASGGGAAARSEGIPLLAPPAPAELAPAPGADPSGELRPDRAMVPPPARPAVLQPIAPARYRVEFTASAELRDKLCRAQALLRHKLPDGDLGEVIDEAVTLLLGKLDARRFGKTKAPRKSLEDTDTSASSRHVPAAVKRAVSERDEGQCTFVDPVTGKRCSCTDPGQLEYHHTTPFARGCDHDPDRIELRCRAHNQHQAEIDFGAEKMARHRNGASRAREPAARYGSAPRRPTVAPSTAPLQHTPLAAEMPNGEQAADSADCGATHSLSASLTPTRRGPPQARAHPPKPIEKGASPPRSAPARAPPVVRPPEVPVRTVSGTVPAGLPRSAGVCRRPNDFDPFRAS